jgi:hypothetical protein
VNQTRMRIAIIVLDKTISRVRSDPGAKVRLRH